MMCRFIGCTAEIPEPRRRDQRFCSGACRNKARWRREHGQEAERPMPLPRCTCCGDALTPEKQRQAGKYLDSTCRQCYLDEMRLYRRTPKYRAYQVANRPANSEAVRKYKARKKLAAQVAN